MATHVIEHVHPDRLSAYERNARTHSKKQISSIAKSIKEFGFRNPVLVDGDDRIIAGHGRVEAAKHLGLNEIPILRFLDMTPDQIRAYVLADNQLALKAGWDRELLAIELQHLVSIDFKMDAIGFEAAEVDVILDEHHGKERDLGQEDIIPPIEAASAISRLGDLWLLGGPRDQPRHRLLVGDAADDEAYSRLMDRRASMVITDPPYNVPIAGHVSGLGRKTHREFVQASGEMSEDEFVGFLASFMRATGRHLTDGALTYVFMDWRHLFELQSAGKRLGLNLLNICVWNKTNGGMGSLYRSKHELCLIFKGDDKPHLNNVELGKHGRSRANVWTYAGATTFRAGRSADLEDHPTVKPALMIADAIRDVTKRNDIVLDPFAGSGTILIAAEMTGRRARAIEIDPLYADVSLRRFEAFSGKPAILAETGETFETVAEKRRSAPSERR